MRRVFCAVGSVVRNFLLLSYSAGEFNWSSTGVVLHDSIAGSLVSRYSK